MEDSLKHWDLRLSETPPFLEWAHKQLNKSNRTQNWEDIDVRFATILR